MILICREVSQMLLYLLLIIWQLGLVESLEDLDYADDICLLSHRCKDMQKKVSDLQSKAKSVGLTINREKTKEMRIKSSARSKQTNKYGRGTERHLPKTDESVVPPAGECR